MSKSRRNKRDSKPKIQHLEAKTENQREYVRSIIENDIVFCSGPSGSGKSTLLNIMSLNDKPTLGNLKIDICKKVYDEVRILYPDEWLILVEIYAIIKSNTKMQSISDEIIEILTNKSKEQKELGKIISRGIKALQS